MQVSHISMQLRLSSPATGLYTLFHITKRYIIATSSPIEAQATVRLVVIVDRGLGLSTNASAGLFQATDVELIAGIRVWSAAASDKQHACGEKKKKASQIHQTITRVADRLAAAVEQDGSLAGYQSTSS
ncbi:MAG: hypothetical protein N838_00220 [Thiohalocapsa sp. PB-PSB1]|jgi:hypothetical protein|nr:MAG: hypothetical protein N838_00220 [Thiohalocapsa sp. PB-PSB1]